MDFDAYLQSKGYSPGEKIPRTTANQLHSAWLKEGGKSSFEPSIVPVTNSMTQEVVPAFMSSPNSATLMKDAAPKVTYKPDADGNLYAIEGTTAAVVTNTQGQPIKVDPKSSQYEEAAALISMGRSAPEPQGEGVGSWLASWMPGSGQSPAPTPEAAPMPSPTPGTAPLQGQTNAPAPAPTPVDLSTPEAIRAAWQAGRLSDQDAVRLLRGQP